MHDPVASGGLVSSTPHHPGHCHPRLGFQNRRYFPMLFANYFFLLHIYLIRQQPRLTLPIAGGTQSLQQPNVAGRHCFTSIVSDESSWRWFCSNWGWGRFHYNGFLWLAFGTFFFATIHAIVHFWDVYEVLMPRPWASITMKRCYVPLQSPLMYPFNRRLCTQSLCTPQSPHMYPSIGA